MKPLLEAPKRIMIRGIPFRIKRVNSGGAYFHVQEQLIELGCGRTKDEEYMWLIHEIDEIILCLNNCRYRGEYDDFDTYQFCYDHTQFEMISRDRAMAIKQLKGIIPK